MKLNFILLLSLILLFVACDEEEIAIPQYYAGDQEFGWATGTRSGQEWEASGYWQYHQNDSTLIGITFLTYSELGERRESYGLNEIPINPGTYTIKGAYSSLDDGFVGGNYARLAADGDVLIGYLTVNDDKNGFVTVTDFNEITRTVKGTFEIYFASENKETTVEIRNGKFELQLYE